MAVVPSLCTEVKSSQPLYRITSRRFQTSKKADHAKVMNGQGAVSSLQGFRYNYPGVLTVYLAEDLETCFAERMFYFLREIVKGLDQSHNVHTLPPFNHHFVLWEVQLTRSISDCFDLKNNFSLFSVFPSMMTSPSQDYEHLKNRRAAIQHEGYEGLLASSSRSTNSGNLVVLFNDQSRNIKSIEPFEVQFRLINTTGSLFANHATELLDFGRGEVRLIGHPSGACANWTKIQFNH